MQRALVTGGAGFIGSNLCDRLEADGTEVVVYDDFRTGRREFVEELIERGGVTMANADILDLDALIDAMDGCDTVFHLQANADVRHGLAHPRRDLEQNALATSNVLEAMRVSGATSIVYASTGSVYGEPSRFPTPEDDAFPIQTSLYGASKVAGEGLVTAYSHALGFTASICRFVSVLGERYTHGHVFDFYRALRADPHRLEVLGNGKQRKSYLYIGDCVNGMLSALRATEEARATCFNLGTDETLLVDESIEIICRHMGVTPSLEYGGGSRGWPGDSPLIHLDCSRLRATGWKPELTVPEALERTLRWLDDNSWVFNERDR